jgi:hypothetical protein
MTPVPGTNLRIATMGGSRVSDLPTFQEQPVPGSFVRRSTQGQPAPTQLTPAPETQRWQLYDAPGPLVPHPYIKDLMVPGPPIKRQVDPITGETRDLVEQGAARPAAGAGGQGAAATGDAQAPGWMDWLKQKTAAK